MPHKLERLVRECVDHSHRMLLWARKPAAENRGFNKIHPHFELIAIQDLLSDTKPLFPQFESALAQLSEAGSGVESFYGITGTSYHQTGLTLAQTILEEVAEATGSILFDGPCIDGRGHVYVAGLGRFDLEQTDLRDRLLKIELSNSARLQALVEKESLSLPGVKGEVPLEADESKVSAITHTKTTTAIVPTELNSYPTPSTYERDKWIHENIAQFNRHTLSLKLKEQAKKRKWQIIGSRNGFKKAADRYANYHKLPIRRFAGD